MQTLHTAHSLIAGACREDISKAIIHLLLHTIDIAASFQPCSKTSCRYRSRGYEDMHIGSASFTPDVLASPTMPTTSDYAARREYA